MLIPRVFSYSIRCFLKPAAARPDVDQIADRRDGSHKQIGQDKKRIQRVLFHDNDRSCVRGISLLCSSSCSGSCYTPSWIARPGQIDRNERYSAQKEGDHFVLEIEPYKKWRVPTIGFSGGRNLK